MARGRLQQARRLLGAAEAREQPAEREPRRRRLAVGALRDEAIVEQARLPRSWPAQRQARARASSSPGRPRGRRAPAARAPHSCARSSTRAPSNGRPRLAKASATARSTSGASAPTVAARARAARAGKLGVERAPHGEGRVAQALGEGQGVGEAPDALVELHGARQIAALDADARRLDVGAVGDQVLDDVAVVR